MQQTLLDSCCFQMSDEIFASVRGDSAGQHQQVLEMGKERAKRLVEQGKDINLIILSLNALALSKQSELEQNSETGAEALAIEAVQESLALGQNFASKGSLTVWAGGHQNRSVFEQKALECILYEVDHRFLLDPKQNSVDIVINETLS